jgi:hypothetical protein
MKVPYTTAREWVLHGRDPGNVHRLLLEKRLTKLEVVR